MTFPSSGLVVTIEAAFGADRTQPPASWSWTDLTDRWHPADELNAQLGARDQESDAGDEQEITFSLKNDDGELTPEDPRSQWWPYVDEGLPMRVTLDPQLPGGETLVLTGYLAEITPVWPSNSARQALVNVVVGGISRHLARGKSPLRSALYRAVAATNPDAYWPLENGADATVAATAVAGQQDMAASGINFAASSTVLGSAPLPDMLESTGRLKADVRGVPGDWTIGFVIQYTGTNLWPAIELDVSGGTYNRIQIAFSDLIEVFGIDESGSTFLNLAVEDLSDGQPHWVAISNEIGGDWKLYADGVPLLQVSPDFGNLRTVTGRSRGSGTTATLGHIPVWRGIGIIGTGGVSFDENDINSRVIPALDGYLQEAAARRVERLCGEEHIPFSMAQQIAFSDDFQTAQSNGWGPDWSTTGGAAADYSVAGGYASVDVDAVDSPRLTTHNVSLVDVDVTTSVRAGVVATPTGLPGFEGSIVAGPTVRQIDADNLYWCGVVFHPDGTVWLSLIRREGGTTVLFRNSSAGLFPYTAATEVGVQVQAAGNTLRARIWDMAGPQPATWNLVWVQPQPLLGPGAVGTRVNIQPNNTNTLPITVDYGPYTVNTLLPEHSELMGPQPITTLPAIVRECAETDRGVLSEANFGYHYRPRVDRYNQTPVLTIDMGNRELAGPFAPTRDDAVVRNQWTISRPGGSSATARDVADQQRRGLKDDSGQANIASDQRLLDHARWRLNETAPAGLRHPQLSVKLHTAPQLLAQVLAVQLGDRAQATNLPPQYPPGGLDQVPVGIRHTVRGRRWWRWDAVVAPYAPWQVGEYTGDSEDPDPDEPKRYDTAGSQLAAAATDAATTLQVLTKLGPRWTEDPAELGEPIRIRVAGERIDVTDIGPALLDTFTRTETDAWGTADTGQAWTLNGTAANFDVAAGVGTIVGSAGGEYATTGDFGDVELLCAVSASTLNGEIALTARWVAPGDFYSFEIDLDAGSQDVSIWRYVSGVPTQLAGVAASFSAGTTYWMRARCVGELLLLRVWQDGTTEPAGWAVAIEDDAHASGAVGCGAFNATGVKSFDTFTVVNPQRFTITRGLDGFSKALPAGADVALAHPARYAL